MRAFRGGFKTLNALSIAVCFRVDSAACTAEKRRNLFGVDGRPIRLRRPLVCGVVCCGDVMVFSNDEYGGSISCKYEIGLSLIVCLAVSVDMFLCAYVDAEFYVYVLLYHVYDMTYVCVRHVLVFMYCTLSQHHSLKRNQNAIAVTE